MGLWKSIETSASGLTAERLRMDLIANNLANVNTTRTAEGGPYRRLMPVFAPRQYASSFFALLHRKLGIQAGGAGVRVVAIAQDQSPPKLVYNPGHPDADADGYVAMPNVNPVAEMVDLISATRAYEANAAAIEAAKAMASRALEIGR